MSSCCLKLLSTRTLSFSSLHYRSSTHTHTLIQSVKHLCWQVSFSWQSSSGIASLEHVDSEEDYGERLSVKEEGRVRMKLPKTGEVDTRIVWHCLARTHCPLPLNWSLPLLSFLSSANFFSLFPVSLLVSNVDISSQRTCQVHHLWMTR